MFNPQHNDTELPLRWQKAKVAFNLVVALLFIPPALSDHEPVTGLASFFLRFSMPLLFCYIAAFEYVQLSRQKAHQSLKQPPPLLLRYVFVAFCVAMTASLLEQPDPPFMHVLLYIGLVAFWGVIFLLGRHFKKQDGAAKPDHEAT